MLKVERSFKTDTRSTETYTTDLKKKDKMQRISLYIMSETSNSINILASIINELYTNLSAIS